MKALIIEDNGREAELVRSLLNVCDQQIECVGIAENVEDGVTMMREHEPEILFLDVELPDGSGFDVLNACRDLNFRVIFVTAHDHYSIQAIRYAAFDYLMKPVEFDDFTKTVARVYTSTLEDAKAKLEMLFVNERANEKRMGVWCQDGLHFINVADIDFIRADGSYSRIYMTDKTMFMATKLLKDFEFLVEADSFVRPHNSYLVNIRHIKTYTKKNGGNLIMVSDEEIPVSRGRRDELLRRLGTWVI